MRKWRQEDGRVGYVSSQAHRNSKSSDTKSLNFGKDLDDISDATRKLEGNDASDDTRMWRQREHNPAT